MQNNNDILAILSLIAASWVSTDIAKQISPLIGVFLAASAGAAYYIGRKGKLGAAKSVGIYALLVGVALTTALPLVELIQVGLNHFGVKLELPKSVGMPVAFLITAFPNHIMDLLRKQKEKWYGKSAELD